MVIKISFKILSICIAVILIFTLILLSVIYTPVHTVAVYDTINNKKFIKWVDFSVCYNALDKALKADIKSQNSDVKLNWIELLHISAQSMVAIIRNTKINIWMI